MSLNANLIRFVQSKEHRKVLIWGCIENTAAIIEMLEKENIEIAGYIDRKCNVLHTYQGRPVYDKIIIKEKAYYVYIAMEYMERAVIDFLNENGYKEYDDWWYPKKKVILDGTRNYSDAYGNEYI